MKEGWNAPRPPQWERGWGEGMKTLRKINAFEYHEIEC